MASQKKSAKKSVDVMGIEQTGAYQHSFIGHLIELKKRLVYSLIALFLTTAIAYLFSKEIYAFLSEPLVMALADQGETRRMIFTGLPEVFLTYIKLSFFTGLMVSFPYIAYQLWLFVAPGLYKDEKKFVIPLLIATPVLFFTGAAFVYYFVLPNAWGFFLSFESVDTAVPIQLEAKVSEYLSITMQLLFGFGFAFELPVFIILLNRAGLVKRETFVKGRKYAIIIIFTVAAFLTPPDVLSQISLGIPMMLLYEIGIFFMRKP